MLESNILVSVILPVYNAIEYLHACLLALSNQTCSSLEIIAIDDGSTDGSGELLDNFECSASFKVIHKPNEGVWRARKVGIEAARGKYIGFCDADDEPLPEMFEELLLAIQTHDAQMAVCPFWRVDANNNREISLEMGKFAGKVLKTTDNPGFLPVINTALWNKLFNAEVIRKSIEFEKPPRILEDMMLQCSVYPFCETVVFTNKPLYRYMVRPGSAMTFVKSDEIRGIQANMVATREFIERGSHDERFLAVCDAMAFIHFGLSIPLRIIQNNPHALGKELKNITLFLKKNFPFYAKNPYFTLNYNFANHNWTLKPMLAKWCYKMHIMKPMFMIYRFVTEKLGKEIKW